MAFIKETERKSLIKRINQSYALKKTLVLLVIVLLVAFIIISFLSLYLTRDGSHSEWLWIGDDDKFTALGIGMLVYAIVMVLLGIVSVILVFTIRSPKSVIKTNKKLEGSALSGKRVYKSQTAGEVMRSRTTLKQDKKKKK